MTRLASLSFVVLVGLVVAGCVSRDISDLEQYVGGVKARKSGKVEPLPEVKPYERYLYQSADRRNPFSLVEGSQQSEIPQIDDVRQRAYLREIQERNKEELEGFELDALRMVGTLQSPADLWGVIKDPEGTVHRVAIGNYMGLNFGKVMDINEDRIDLREIVKDIHGNWEERQTTMALYGEE